jgi:hypothetical protein
MYLLLLHKARLLKLTLNLSKKVENVKKNRWYKNDLSRVSNIESDNSQNVGLEDYNNISDGIFPYFTTPSIKITLG